jgi:hypothetical protein
MKRNPIATPLRLAGLLTLSFGLFACGQSTPTASTTVQTPAAVSSQNPSPKASEPTEPAASAVSSKSERSSIDYSADKIYTEFERLTEKTCQKQKKDVGKVRYVLCSTTDSQGLVKTVSASSSLIGFGDGVAYWLNENGDIYAIRYLHSGEIVVLLPEDKNTLVELVGKREIKVITDEARWNKLELSARDGVMKISEQFDSLNSTPKSSANSDRQTVEQIALARLNGGNREGTIRKLAIVDDTALLSWGRGEMGGMMLLRKEQGNWTILTSGGGAMNLMTLSEYNVPRPTAQALLKELNLN